MIRVLCFVIFGLFLTSCVYQNVTLDSHKLLEDGTKVEMTSRTINFSFSKYIEDGISSLFTLLTQGPVIIVPPIDPVDPEPVPPIEPEPVEPEPDPIVVDPVDPEPVDPPTTLALKTISSHYNPDAYEMGPGDDNINTTHVLGKGIHMDSCKINDIAMKYHGQDGGRDTWIKWGMNHIAGIMSCTADGEIYTWKVSGGSMQKGDMYPR